MMENETWVMPEWMEPHRKFIANTGGNSVEELMNDKHTHVGNNTVRAMLIASVSSQVLLLERLKNEGVL